VLVQANFLVASRQKKVDNHNSQPPYTMLYSTVYLGCKEIINLEMLTLFDHTNNILKKSMSRICMLLIHIFNISIDINRMFYRIFIV